MIVSVPVVSLSSSWPPVRVIVCGVAKTVGSKVIVWPGTALAQAIASRRLVVPLAEIGVVGGGVDHEAGDDGGLDLERADVDRAVDDAGLPRWSVVTPAGMRALLPASMAGLPDSRAIVWVGPP